MTTETSTDRIRKTIELKAPVARVWRALTEHREFGEWFGVDLESPFEPGRATQGRLTISGYEHMTLEVFVKDMTPPNRFSYEWHPYAIDPEVDYSQEPSTLVEFELQEMEGGTLLIVTESGFDALPAERREEAYRMNEGGWKGQLRNIEAHVTSHP